MPVITLISDRKTDDFFLGRVKGQIHTSCPSSVIIDLAHEIGNFNVTKTGFILKNSYKDFAEGTVHIIAVDSEKGSKQRHLAVKAKGQYFIGADNGVFSLIFEEHEIEQIVSFSDTEEKGTNAPALFRFADVAVKIIKGAKLLEIGTVTNEHQQRFTFNPSFDEDHISGKIIYIDSYKNAISNISKELFESIWKLRYFEISVGNTGEVIDSLSKKYQDVEPGELLALFNSMNLLELAQNKGNIADIFNMDVGANIRIDFYDN